MPHNPAKTLIEKIWGSNFFDSIPPEWKAAIKLLRLRTPGVPNNTDPDVPTTITSGVLGDEVVATSQVTTNRTNELEKETTKVQTDLLLDEVEHGQDLDDTFNLVLPYTKHLALDGAEIGDAGKEIRPLNPILSEVRELDISAFTAVLNAYLLSFPGTSTVNIPDILTGLEVSTNQSIGDGTSYETGAVYSVSGSYSYTIPYSSTSQGSAVITKEVIPTLLPFWGSNRDVTHYLFFLPAPVTRAQIIAKLAALTGLSVVSWPVYSPRYVTIVITYRQVSLQVEAKVTLHEESSGSGFAQVATAGGRISREIGLTTKTIRIPPSIHGNLTLATGVTDSDAVTVDASAGPGLWAGFSEISQTENAWVNVEAFGLGATPGAQTLPNSGLLIVDVNARPYKYGYVMIQVETLDASTL